MELAGDRNILLVGLFIIFSLTFITKINSWIFIISLPFIASGILHNKLVFNKKTKAV
jgi:hypothetical protein